jgi:branched-chain amino acid transport system substrate-binding protein
MDEYKVTPETAPDMVVGKGYFIFPVLQYFDGEGKIIFPPDLAEQEFTPKGEAPAAEEATEVFKLGVLGPFSGANARTGEEFRGSVEMAFEGIDYQVGKYKVELVWIDSQSDPAKATEAYEEAVVQKGIQAGLLNWHSSVAVACMEVAAKYKIPHFLALGATDVVNETWQSDKDKYFYWLKGWPEPGLLTTAYVQTLENAIAEGIWTPKDKTAALWGEETDWARSFLSGMRKQLEDVGWDIVSEDYFPLDQTEFVPLLTRMKELNPTIFAGTASAPPLYSALIKQAEEVGLESLIVADGLGWVGEWYDLTGDSSNYVVDQI